MFDEIRGIWIADETPSRVFDKSCQSQQKLGANGGEKLSKSVLIKTRYPNRKSHGCDFLCFNLMNYL